MIEISVKLMYTPFWTYVTLHIPQCLNFCNIYNWSSGLLRSSTVCIHDRFPFSSNCLLMFSKSLPRWSTNFSNISSVSPTEANFIENVFLLFRSSHTLDHANFVHITIWIFAEQFDALEFQYLIILSVTLLMYGALLFRFTSSGFSSLFLGVILLISHFLIKL